MFLKAREAKSSFYDVFLRVRKTKAPFYIDSLRKTIAGRPFWKTAGTIRDRIGTEINQAGVRSLPGLGFAQRWGGFRFRLAPNGGFNNCNGRLPEKNKNMRVVALQC